MNNNAFGTIAGLQAAHYGLTYGTTFESGSDVPDYAAIARAYGVAGIRVTEAAEFRPAVEQALASNKPALIDVAMVNNPTPTTATGTFWTSTLPASKYRTWRLSEAPVADSS